MVFFLQSGRDFGQGSAIEHVSKLTGEKKGRDVDDSYATASGQTLYLAIVG